MCWAHRLEDQNRHTFQFYEFKNFQGRKKIERVCFGSCNEKKVTYLSEGGDEGDEADDTGVGEELGDFTDSSDVLLSVGEGEAEILVEAVSDIVTVKDVSWDTLGDEVLLELHGDGRFTGSGETGEPDSAAVEST